MSDTAVEQSIAGESAPKPIVAGVPPHWKGTAILRVKNTKFGPSSSGNPMITLEQEIIVPETVESPFDGKRYALDSAKLMMWILLWNTDKSGNPLQNGLDWVNNYFLPEILGIKDRAINVENPLYHAEKNPDGIKLDGLTWEAVVETEERIEQRRLPNGKYEVLKDMRGNPIKRGFQWCNTGPADVLRLAEVETNRAF